MTEQSLYTHIHYIWHRVLLHVIVMGPFAIAGEIAKIISDVTYKPLYLTGELQLIEDEFRGTICYDV